MRDLLRNLLDAAAMDPAIQTMDDMAARLIEQGVRLGHPDAGQEDRNHYDWFMPANPQAAVDAYLDDFEAKMWEALTDPFVHDMAQAVLPLIAAYRAVRPAATCDDGHVLNGLDCWCRPYPDTEDPTVIIHRTAGRA